MAVFWSRSWMGPSALTFLVVACSSDPRPSTSFQLPPGEQGGTVSTGSGMSGGSAGSPGGAATVGGALGAGGSTGGVFTGMPTGGTPAKGGSTSDGGDSSDGGAPETGGKTSSGGSSGGSKATGTGGSKASGSGGSPATGGANQGGSPDSDGGDGGAPAPDGDFFGDSRCSDEFELCEDFEGSGLDGDLWETMGSAPAFETVRAARGAKSGHFSSTNNGLMLIRNRSVFPMPDNRYYGRLFVWFDVLPTGPRWAHWSVAAAQGEEDAEIRVGGQFDGEINRYGVGTDHGATGDWTNLDQDSDEPVPTRRWICVEWMHDGESDETRLWIDEQERPSLHTTPELHGGSDDPYLMPEFTSAWVGFWQYADGVTPSEFDVWVDEVVFDDERVTCTR